MEDIADKANKCLNCKKPMCSEGCPISTNIPRIHIKNKRKKLRGCL